MKKILFTIITLVVLCLSFVSVSAAETENGLVIRLKINESTMTVNNEEKPIDENGTVPVIVNGRTLLPVRAVVEEIGGDVSWDSATKTVSLKCENNDISLVIDSTEAYLNGEAHTLDTPPTIIEGRTMLPIRFIAEGFGLDVEWNAEEQTVTLTKKKAEEEENTASNTEAVTETTTAEEITEDNKSVENKILVAYFSATNNTKGVAEKIAETTGADIFEIVPQVPYTSADLDYNSDCRANTEQNDDSARPEISNTVENMDEYDTVFLGYPIWWGQAPKIIYTFLESYDFGGKTVIPFCTSGSSPIEPSIDGIQALTEGANWLEGRRFSGGASAEEVSEWLNEMEFSK